MNIYSVIFLILFSFVSAQKLIHTEVYKNGNIKSISYHKKRMNKIEKVKYEEYFEAGRKYSDTRYKNGYVDGLMTFWYENGVKKEEITYSKGIEQGVHTWWYENGFVKSKGSYLNGMPQGFWVYYYKNGQKSGEGIIKDGKQDGLVKEWHSNGQVAEERLYKNGNFISKIEWSEDGSLKR